VQGRGFSAVGVSGEIFHVVDVFRVQKEDEEVGRGFTVLESFGER